MSLKYFVSVPTYFLKHDLVIIKKYGDECMNFDWFLLMICKRKDA